MSYKIAVLPGDGIGPEVMREGTQVLNQAAKLHGFKVELEEGVVGGASIDAHGKPLTDSVLKLAKESNAVLLGAMALVNFGFDTTVYSRGAEPNPKAALVATIGAHYIDADAVPVEALPGRVGNIDLIYEAAGASKVAFDAMKVLGTNGIFTFYIAGSANEAAALGVILILLAALTTILVNWIAGARMGGVFG